MDTLMSLESLQYDKNCKNYDEVVRHLGIPNALPEQYWLWRVLPEPLKQFWMGVNLSEMTTLIFCMCMVVIPAFSGIVYGIVLADTPRVVLGALLAFASLFYGAGSLLLFFYLASLYEVLKATDLEKQRTIYDYCKETIEKYREKFFDPKNGEFAQLDLKFQKQVRSAIQIHDRFHWMLQESNPESELHFQLTQDCKEAEECWEIIATEQESFLLRKQKVLAGLDRLEVKIDLVSQEYAYGQLKQEFVKQRNISEKLITNAADRYYRLALDLSSEFENMEMVLKSLAPYSNSISQLGMTDTVQDFSENRHRLLAANIHSAELDQVIDSMGIEPQPA